MSSPMALLIVPTSARKCKGRLGGGEIEDSWSHVDWRMVWQILDQAQVQLAGERFDEANENWDTARRRHG